MKGTPPRRCASGWQQPQMRETQIVVSAAGARLVLQERLAQHGQGAIRQKAL
jgi:hypothetical protein